MVLSKTTTRRLRFRIACTWGLTLLFCMGCAHTREAGEIRITDLRAGTGMTIPVSGWVQGVVELSFTPRRPADVQDVIADISFRAHEDTFKTGIRIPIQLTDPGTRWIPFLLPVPTAGSPVHEIRVEIRDTLGHTLASEARPLTRRTSTQTLHVAYIGADLASYFMPADSPSPLPRQRREPAIPTTAAAIQAEELPHHFAGYDGIATLLWRHPDLAALEDTQRNALADYIRQGGHLVFVAPVSTPAPTLTPAEFAPLPGVWSRTEQRVSLPTSRMFRRLPGLYDPKEAMEKPFHPDFNTVPVRSVEEVYGRTLLRVRDLPLLVRGHYGAGTVTMLGVDVGAAPFPGTPEGTALLSRALELPLAPRQLATLQGRRPHLYLSQYGNRHLANEPSAVIHSLFPGAFDLRPTRPLWVFLLTMAYATCAGPMLYFLLKRSNRLGQTTLFFAACSAGFTVLIYTAAFWMKGDTVETMEVGILDVSRDRRGTLRRIGTLYAPRPGHVNLDAGEGAVVGSLVGTRRQELREWRRAEKPLVFREGGRYVPNRDGVAPDSIRLHQWAISSFSVHETVDDVPPPPDLWITIETRTPQTDPPWSQHFAHIRERQGRRLHLPPSLLLTAEGCFPFRGTEAAGVPEWIQNGTSLAGGMSCGADLHGWFHIPYTVRRRVWGNAVQFSFPRLAGQYRTLGSFGTMDDLLDALSPEETLPGPRLTPWQILVATTDVNDLFGFDLTRVLCEGGGVLLQFASTPPGTLEVEGRPVRRLGHTIRRDVIPPERIRRRKR